MSVTATNVLPVPHRIDGNLKRTVYDVKFDSSYLAEGETLASSSVGLSSFETATATVKKPAKSVNVAQVYYDGSKIHLYDETPGEVASEADVYGLKVRVTSCGV